MRNIFIDKLIDLKSKLSVLNARQLEFLKAFKSKNSIGDITHLERYHQQVLSWLNEWQRSFFESIRIESAFQEADLSDERFMPAIQRKCLELKTYLLLHSGLLPFGIVDFTDTPFMVAHAALLFAAEVIVTDETSACELLMPWVKSVKGTANEKDIKAATEEACGTFKPWRYISGKDKKSLHAIVDELDYVNASPGDKAKQFFMSDERMYLKCRMSGSLQTSYVNYTKVLEYFFHKVTSDPSVFSYHVYRLSAALHERSVQREGHEFVAGDESTADIQNFRRVWLSLAETDRQTLSAATIKDTKLNFGEYLILIFATSQDVVLTPEELLVVAKHAKQLRCAAILSSVLSSFVYEHKEWSEQRIVVLQAEAVPDFYTPSDIPVLRQIFVDALDDDEARLFSNTDALMSAIHPPSATGYDRFFFISRYLSLFTNETLNSFPADSSVSLFHSQDAILCVLKKIDTVDQRNEFFRLFEEDIKPHFDEISDVVLLMHFFDVRLFQKIRTTFQVEALYRVSSSNPPFFCTPEFLTAFKKHDIDFRMDVLYAFTVYMLRPDNPSPIIFGMTQLLSCLMFCQTEEACDTVLELAKPLIPSFLAPEREKKKGAALVKFCQLFQSVFRAPSDSDVDASRLLEKCVVLGLSFLLSQRVFDALWEKASQPTSAWCSCFSIKVNREDGLFYRAFSDSEEWEERVNLLFRFVASNQGGKFLVTLKEAFAPDFFNMACSIPRKSPYVTSRFSS